MIFKDQFLLVQRLDGKLRKQGTPVGLSQERTATLRQLVSASDGSVAVAFYFDQSLRAVALRCGATTPPPLGPGQCPEKSAVSPLDDGCKESVCYAVIRFDYKSLGLKGYAIVGAPYQPTDAAAAKLAAEAAFKTYGQYLSDPLNLSLSPLQAGLYPAYVAAGDFGGYCMIGADSGVAVSAGGIVWAGRGQYWVPSSWMPIDVLSCGPSAATAHESYSAAGVCTSSNNTPGSPYAAKDALNLALRLNLTAYYAGRGPFSVHAMLYTPTIGHCDPDVAEFVVILSQRRQ